MGKRSFQSLYVVWSSSQVQHKVGASVKGYIKTCLLKVTLDFELHSYTVVAVDAWPGFRILVTSQRSM